MINFMYGKFDKFFRSYFINSKFDKPNHGMTHLDLIMKIIACSMFQGHLFCLFLFYKQATRALYLREIRDVRMHGASRISTCALILCEFSGSISGLPQNKHPT